MNCSALAYKKELFFIFGTCLNCGGYILSSTAMDINILTLFLCIMLKNYFTSTMFVFLGMLVSLLIGQKINSHM